MQADKVSDWDIGQLGHLNLTELYELRHQHIASRKMKRYKNFFLKSLFVMFSTFVMSQFSCQEKNNNLVNDSQSIKHDCVVVDDSLFKQGFVYQEPDVPPKYPGGTSALQARILENVGAFPEGQRLGKVKVAFVIDSIGEILAPRIIDKDNKFDIFYNKVIAALNNLDKWEPGKCEEKRVFTLYRLTIYF